jgi:hypothetical protein
MYTLILFLVIFIIMCLIANSQDELDTSVFFGAFFIILLIAVTVSFGIGICIKPTVVKTNYELQLIDKNVIVSTEDAYVIKVNNKNIYLDKSDVEIQFVEEKPRLEKIETISRPWEISWGFEVHNDVDYIIYLTQ